MAYRKIKARLLDIDRFCARIVLSIKLILKTKEEA